MSLGIDKLEELAKEVVELAKSVAVVMEDKKVSFSDAIPLVAAAKDVYDIAAVAQEAYEQVKDLDKEELAKVGEISVKLVKELSEIYGLKL
jgi:hypothetical protein